MAGNNRPGVIAELEEVEVRQEECPLTRASLTLLDKLTDTEIPGSLGAGARAPGFQPYLSYIQVAHLGHFNSINSNNRSRYRTMFFFASQQEHTDNPASAGPLPH